MTKCCSCCRRELPLDAFNRYHRGTHGRQAYCRECHGAKQTERSQRPDVIARRRESDKKRRATEEYRAKARAYSERWRQQNRETHNRRANAARNRDPEKMRVQSARTRAKLYGVENTLTLVEWLAVLEEHEHRCAYCSGPFQAMDHVVPLARGGGNTAANVVPACRRCNCSKHTRDEPLKEHH